MIRPFLMFCMVLCFAGLSNAQITIERIYFTSGAEVAVEGCPDTIVVELTARVLNDTLAYNVLVSGEADDNDYTSTLPDTVLFTNNDLRLFFPITHIADGVAEGSEMIRFNFVNIETSDFEPFTYDIYDEMPLDILYSEDTLCLKNIVILSGFGAGNYTWFSQDSSVLTDNNVFEYFPENRDTVFIRGQIHGCVKDTFKVFEFYDDDLSINQEDTVFICKGDSAELSVRAVNGTVTWTSDLPGIVSPTTGENVTVNTDISSYVYARLDGENCTIFDTVYIRVDSLPEYAFLENVPGTDTPCLSYCPGQLVTLTLNTTDPTKYPDAEFQWAPMRGIEEGSENQNVLLSTEADTIYYVRTTTNNACESKDSILIPTVDTTIRLNLTDTSVCLSDPANPVQVNILNNPDRIDSISWSPEQGLSCTDCLNPVITTSQTQEYSVEAIIDGCCPSSASVTVTVDTIPIPIDNVTICPGEEAIIIVMQNDLTNPEWIGNTDGLNCINCFSTVATVENTRSFTLQAVDPEGCINQGMVRVSVLDPTLAIDIIPEPSGDIGVGGTVSIETITTPLAPDTNAIFYELNGQRLEQSGPNVQILINEEGENILRVITIDDNGCEVSETFIINGVEPDIEMPNAFTPNNDDRNDIFRPVVTNAENAEGLAIDAFRIYNRWGEMVYQYSPDDQVQGWDGRYNGELAPPEVYLYQISLRLPNGDIITLDGDVTLIR